MSSESVIYWPKEWHTQTIRVVLIGAGGNGSELFDALVKFHHALIALGHESGLDITVFDGDDISKSNIIRQKFWPHEVGQNKAVTLVHRVNMMFGTKWKAKPYMYDVANSVKISEIDLLITCVDNYKTRRLVHEIYSELLSNALWLDLGNGQSHGQITLGHLAQTDVRSKTPNVVDIYPEILKEQDAPTRVTCSMAESISQQDLYINQAMANSAMNLLWQLLKSRKLDFNEVLVNLGACQIEPVMNPLA